MTTPHYTAVGVSPSGVPLYHTGLTRAAALSLAKSFHCGGGHGFVTDARGKRIWDSRSTHEREKGGSMIGVTFYRDHNDSKGWNGLALFTEHPVRKQGKTGHEAFTAMCPGAGDGPYVAAPVSAGYLKRNCEEITEAEARKRFPKLVVMVEGAKEVWV